MIMTKPRSASIDGNRSPEPTGREDGGRIRGGETTSAEMVAGSAVIGMFRPSPYSLSNDS